MIFKGIEIRFICKNNEQYETIGAFWDYMKRIFPDKQLRGLGYNWSDDCLSYVIGDYNQTLIFNTKEITQQYPSAKYMEIMLPDDGWQTYSCRIEKLGYLYEEIYKDGALDYEIEEIHANGDCKISIIRMEKERPTLLGLKHGAVILVDHDPAWETNAAETIRRLWDIFGSEAEDIKHVGSTSIRHIKAKPIIDIAVAVYDFDRVSALIPSLKSNGFFYRGWEGENDKQMVFKCGELVPGETDMRTVTHYVHVGLSQHGYIKKYINYRDYMNAFPAAAYEYEALKIQLANEVNAGGDFLCYHPGKGEFITRMIQTANDWDANGRKTVLELCRQRYSCRNFSDTPIPDGIITYILECSRLSASGGNAQPWKFGVVTESALIEAITEAASVNWPQPWIAKAPLLIVLCTELNDHPIADIGLKRFPSLLERMEKIDQDLLSALAMEEHQTKIPGEHMVLAAMEHGIQSTWISSVDCEKVAELLGIKGYLVSNVIAFGYPEGSGHMALKKDMEQIIFRNCFNK
jgi:GrpB-like predicted nucleotidyltransferase (UPF0157 family)/nitroreductase